MKSSTKLVLGILAFTLALTGAVLGYQALQGRVEPMELPEQAQSLAADFAMEDAQGNAVRLSDLRGKPVVLNFWASWCGYCVVEMPEFETLYRELGDEVRFVMLNCLEDKSRGAAFMAGQDYTFPVYYDVNQEAQKAYGISSIPVTCFISRDGELVYRNLGAMSEQALLSAIDKIR